MNKAVTHPFQKLLACRHRLGDAGHRRLDGRVGDHRAHRPADRMTAGTEAEHTPERRILAVDGSADVSEPRHSVRPKSPLSRRSTSEDPAQIGPAVEALVGSAPEEIAAPSAKLIANGEAGPEIPRSTRPYGAMIDYVRANCGFGETRRRRLRVRVRRGSRRAARWTDHPHRREHRRRRSTRSIIARINDDVTLTLEELLALPEEESDTMVDVRRWRLRGLPRDQPNHGPRSHPRPVRGHLLLPAGRHPRGVRADDGGRGGRRRFDPRRLGPEDRPAEGSAPVGTDHADMAADTDRPTALRPPRVRRPSRARHRQVEEGPPHFMLGMVQEFTVV